MKAIVLYSSQGNLAPLAKGIAEGLEAEGIRVDLLQAGERGSGPVPVGSYDLVVVGSPVVGGWRATHASDIDDLLKRCTRLEGRAAVAFVSSRLLGTTRALRSLMGALEHQGALVQDFSDLRNSQQAREFGRRLKAVVLR